MGWAYGENSEGREIGYAVEADCDEPECLTRIDRGISYVCGGMHDGGEFGCGKYFCARHKTVHETPEGYVSLCAECAAAFDGDD